MQTHHIARMFIQIEDRLALIHSDVPNFYRVIRWAAKHIKPVGLYAVDDVSMSLVVSHPLPLLEVEDVDGLISAANY